MKDGDQARKMKTLLNLCEQLQMEIDIGSDDGMCFKYGKEIHWYRPTFYTIDEAYAYVLGHRDAFRLREVS